MDNIFNQITDISDLRLRISLKELEIAALNGQLLSWLQEHLFDGQADLLQKTNLLDMSEGERKYFLCRLLGISILSLDDADCQDIEEWQHLRKQLRIFTKSNDAKIHGCVVKNQKQLLAALMRGEKTIYLDDNEFQVPRTIRDAHYIGKNGSVVDISYSDDVDFSANNITFDNVTFYKHYPINLNLDGSNDIRVIDGSQSFLGNYQGLGEVYALMQNQQPFESQKDFTERISKAKDISAGSVFLFAEDYNMKNKKFELLPEWNPTHLSLFRRFVKEKFFWLRSNNDMAKNLFFKERKLPLFMNLCTHDKLVDIKSLYLLSPTYGKIEVIWQTKKDAKQTTLFSGGYGYGLDLIEP